MKTATVLYVFTLSWNPVAFYSKRYPFFICKYIEGDRMGSVTYDTHTKLWKE